MSSWVIDCTREAGEAGEVGEAGEAGEAGQYVVYLWLLKSVLYCLNFILNI